MVLIPAIRGPGDGNSLVRCLCAHTVSVFKSPVVLAMVALLVIVHFYDIWSFLGVSTPLDEEKVKDRPLMPPVLAPQERPKFVEVGGAAADSDEALRVSY